MVDQILDAGYSRNRMSAIKYAYKYYDIKLDHDKYPYLEFDCTNFASQILKSGRLDEDNNWWYKGFERLFLWRISVDASDSWLIVGEFLDSLTKNKGFIDTIVNSREEIHRCVVSGKVQPGDIVIMGNTHSSFVSAVDKRRGKLYYAAHTDSRLNKDLDLVYEDGDYAEYDVNMHIIHTIYPDEVRR